MVMKKGVYDKSGIIVGRKCSITKIREIENKGTS